MKLIAILLTVFFLQVKADGFSQGTVTYSGTNVPLEQVISAIKKQTGYTFFYTEDIWNNTKPVTLNVRNAEVGQVMQLIVRNQPIRFIIEEKVIILSHKKVQERSMPVQHVVLPLLEIRGRVTGENGSGLEGVNVIVKGTENGTITNAAGEFQLKNVNEKAVLVVSCVGYEKEEVTIDGTLYISLQLKANTGNLDEVQVIGYGKSTKRLNTGNVSTIKSSVIEKQPINNPLLALQGRVPGLQIGVGTGLPGASVGIRVRGINNLGGSSEPLYIIDGVPYQANNLEGTNGGGILGGLNGGNGSAFSFINPSDIESIDVLKDADATAIYGSRGANGVILITTKKGKAGRTKGEVNYQKGFGRVANKMRLLDTRQYLDMRYEAIRNDGQIIDKNRDYDLALWDTTTYTDWQDELIGGTARYNDAKITVTGGNASTQFLIGSGYHKETTVFPGDFKNEKASVQFNINNSSNNQKLKISLSGFYVNDNNNVCPVNLAQVAVQMMPNAPKLYNEDGSFNWARNSSGVSTWPSNVNPAALLTANYEIKTNNVVSNATASYFLFRNIEVKANAGYSNIASNGIYTLPMVYFDPVNWPTSQRSSIFSNSNQQSWIIEPQLNFSKKIRNITVDALVGSTIQQSRSSEQSLNATGFNSDQEMRSIIAATNISVTSSSYSVYKYNALFGRINCNYKDKYIINMTGRRDGSSRFGPANHFHTFLAVGAAWLFTKEKVFEDAVRFLSFGKVRGSFGTTGSDDIGDYVYMDLYNSVTNIGVPYQGGNGLIPSRIYTPDIKWQSTKKIEIALELGFLKDRIFFSGNYYRNRSSNQLLSFALPSVTGFTGIRKNMNAVVENVGIELELNGAIVATKNFKYNCSINFTLNRNKLVSGAPGLSAALLQKVGFPVQTSFVYKYLNVDPISGLYVVADAHGNPTSTPNAATDAIVPIDLSPKFFGGIQNVINIKSFQLDFLVQFVRQTIVPLYRYNSIPGYVSNSSFGANQPIAVLDRWRQPGDVAKYQRYSQDLTVLSSKLNADGSDFLYGDGSYMTLRNASVSWQPPAGKSNPLKIISRVFIQGQNLFCLSKNRDMLNPEAPSPIFLPPLRVITMGVKITL